MGIKAVEQETPTRRAVANAGNATIFHKHDGVITRVHAIGHDNTSQSGIPTWHYECDVLWRDGTSSMRINVLSFLLCYDGAIPGSRERYVALSDAMNDYLQRNGKWSSGNNADTYAGWKPFKPIDREELPRV